MVCVCVQGGAQCPVSEGEDAEEGRTGGGQEGQADGATKVCCGDRGTQEVILINNTCWYSFGGLWGGMWDGGFCCCCCWLAGCFAFVAVCCGRWVLRAETNSVHPSDPFVLLELWEWLGVKNQLFVYSQPSPLSISLPPPPPQPNRFILAGPRRKTQKQPQTTHSSAPTHTPALWALCEYHWGIQPTGSAFVIKK